MTDKQFYATLLEQVEAQINLTEPGDDNDIELTESLTYLKSIL